jgi:hypothetical protein
VVLVVSLVAALAVPAAAAADDWFPHNSDSTWTYQWSDSVYSKAPTLEDVSVTDTAGTAFTLAWTSDTETNDPAAAKSSGQMSFAETTAGLVNTGWSSNAPPATFPILCAKAAGCNNTIGAALHLLIWGSRGPMLAEPLLDGVSWASTGGASNDVASVSSYSGTESVTVPAFPMPVTAAKVRSDISQSGALGDPFGSGVRYVWWVYGVGPVKIEFDHTGGAVTTAVLTATDLTPKPAPADANYFPLDQGLTSTYRWKNTKYFKTQSVVEQFHVDAVSNMTAQVSVKSVSGPISMLGAYAFTLRTDGITCLWGHTKAASKAALPALGPSSLPKTQRRHFFTPYDLMTFGFNPLIPAYPAADQGWSNSGTGRDFAVYGVTGSTQVVGLDQVKVPAGTFQALVVQSTLKQAGFPAGTGTRTSWFAPGVGLVKLVFKHGDGSTSTVDLMRTTAGS